MVFDLVSALASTAVAAVISTPTNAKAAIGRHILLRYQPIPGVIGGGIIRQIITYTKANP